MPLDADRKMSMEPNLTLSVNSTIETTVNQTCVTDGSQLTLRSLESRISRGGRGAWTRGPPMWALFGENIWGAGHAP